METFDFNETPVRVVIREDGPWFVAADACRVLEIQNSRDAVSGLEDDERAMAAAVSTVGSAETTVGNADIKIPNRGLQIISESGLYALIFKSRKPEAKKFRKWVTSVVLPEIRKTGAYSPPMPMGEVESVSLLAFVRECCAGWPLDRQMEFGQLARRYAKSLGVVFQTGHEAGVGRVFVFPRPVLRAVYEKCGGFGMLQNPEADEFERLLRALHAEHEDARLLPEAVRGTAKTLGLFPRIFGAGTTLESERSAFGRLCERYDGSVFPSGLLMRVCGHGPARRYEIKRLRAELAMPA